MLCHSVRAEGTAMPSQFRLVHVGVAAALAAATATAIGLVQVVGAAGGSVPSAFVPIVPCRLVDTRPAPDNVGKRATPLGAAESATFAVWGTNGDCTIPNTATGVAMNVTAVNPTSASYITVFPADANPRPTASNLNVVAGGAPTPNQVTVGLSAGGAISAYNNGGTLNLLVDIVGFYQPATSGSGPQGPPGPQGVQGIQGPAGPTCPAGGCTMFFGAADVMTSQAAGTAPYFGGTNVGCAHLTANQTYAMPLDLPQGATIIAIVNSKYNGDFVGATYQLFKRGPASSGYSPTAVSALSAPNDGAETQMSLTSGQITPVSASSIFVILATVGSGGAQYWCGAKVTYTL